MLFRSEDEEKNSASDFPAIESLIKEGQEVVVQIIRESTGDKGARVTTNLSLPGRFVVLLLGNNQHLGISRKITDEEERQRLYNCVQRIKLPDAGMIVRTLAEGVPEKEISEDVEKLISLKQEIKLKIENKKERGILYSSNDPFSRLLREVKIGRASCRERV